MSYRSEMKNIIEKYYPQYKVKTVLAPTLHNLGITNNEELRITIPLVKKKKESKKPTFSAHSNVKPYYNGESIQTIERNEGHGFWGNASSGYITDEQLRNMP